MNRQRASSVLWGIFFIVLGVALALRFLDLFEFDIFFDGWWTLFIIIPSLIGMVKRGVNTSSLIGLAVGLSLLLVAQDLISSDIFLKLLIPAILVIIGLKLIFKETFNKTISAIKGINQSHNREVSAVFGEQNADFTGQEFLGANINAVFGGVSLNLRNAIINEDVVINASSIFGGTTIYVPNNVKIKVNSIPIFGGVSNKTIPTLTENAPTIFINATCMFGGVDIK